MDSSRNSFVHRLGNMLDTAFTLVGGCLLMAMMFHVVLDVFFKYVFSSPIVGTLEIVSNYYMVAVVFLPLALVERSQGHVKVEIFTTALPDRAVAALDIVAKALCLVFVSLLGWFALDESISQTLIWEKIEIGAEFLPIWPARWFAPFGVFFFLFALLVGLRADFDRLRGRGQHLV